MLTSSTRQLVIISIFGIVSIGILFGVGIFNSCGIVHVNLINDLQEYEKNLDPEFCDKLVHQIIELNDDCDTDIEIVDCG